MALKSGYGYDTVCVNIRTLNLAGTAYNQSVILAYNHARKCFFKRFPNGLLEKWLQYPYGKREKKHYYSDGSRRPEIAPVTPQEYKTRRNPANATTKELGADLRKASALFKGFAGHAPKTLRKLSLPDPITVGVAFGTLVEVTYQSARDGQLYSHTFRKSSRPLVVASHDGKLVQIVGGRYAFTKRGIVDR